MYDTELPDLSLLETRAADYARRAGDLLMDYFRRPIEREFKGEQRREPVSIADREAERLIRDSIRQDFPDHGVLGEEGTAEPAQRTDLLWVVDPLDGTTNFLNHIPFFASSIGVLYRRESVAGAIFVPVSAQGGPAVYHARRGGGAFLDDRPVTVSSATRGGSAELAAVPAGYRSQFAPSKELRRHGGELRSLGSIACEMALAAAGGLLYSVHGAPRIWDVAAGAILVKEAGGQCLQHDPRRKHWRPLEQFEVERTEGQDELEGLRRWSRPLVAGNPEVAWFVARNVRLRRTLLRRLLALLGWS